MADFKDHIFIFDLHNTLYDEVLEYGGAMAAAVQCFFKAAQAQGVELDLDAFYEQLAAAHARGGSDWDNDVWAEMPELQKLTGLDTIIRDAVEARQAASEALTKRYAYTETLSILRDLKEQGARLILATEATANAAAEGALWLDLDGVLDAVYSWPYEKPYQKLAQTRQCFFPAHADYPGLYLQKPHAMILGQILLDVAKEEGSVPDEVKPQDVYDLAVDESVDIAPLLGEIKNPESSPQAVETVKSMQLRLGLKEGAYKDALADLWGRAFYVGDSFFKDGFLALNAGLPFIHAGYGKVVDNQKTFEEAKEILYRVTGWEPFLLQLTQEAAKLPELTAQIQPHFVCKESLQEFLDFKGNRI